MRAESCSPWTEPWVCGRTGVPRTRWGAGPPRAPGPASGSGGDAPDDRWTIIRDALVLQLKLVLEGIKDVLLGPVALVAAVWDLLSARRSSGERRFYRVVRSGASFERWLNLYGALRESDGDRPVLKTDDREGVDAYVRKVEEVLRREHERGGVTTGAKRLIDGWLDRIEEPLSQVGRGPPPGCCSGRP